MSDLKYSVEDGWLTGWYRTATGVEGYGVFDTIEEAREVYESIDIVSTWETEKACGSSRWLDRDTFKQIVEVYDRGDYLEYVDVVEHESYNGDDIKRERRERIEDEVWREWRGDGWYRIAYSDGGQDATNEGAVWYEFRNDLEDDLEVAYEYATETHLPFIEYMGDGDKPTRD